ncbi:MAG: hypothetical protein H8D67_12700, partial [Deltaproteobacteria bacterium]|nr:hypothetical protein [Deltaproteobacteria bacterium]
MSNPVGDLIEDVAYRIDEMRMEAPYTHAVILRAMRRVYQQLNEELKVIEHEFEVDFSSPGVNDSLADGYWGLPYDCIVPFKVPNYRYVPNEAWKDSENYTFTIYNNRIYFANASESLALTVAYYSSGYTLVDDDSPSGTDVNEPEYPDHLQQILLYGTAIELKNDYPKFESDIRSFLRLKSALGRTHTLKQLVSVEKTGPQKYSTLT